MAEVSINWAAVAVATIVNMVIGGLWYSPVLFAKPWTAEVEKTIGKERFQRLHDAMRTKGTAIRTYGLMFVGAFLVSYGMGLIVGHTSADTVALGLIVGSVAWLCFVVTTSLVTVLFEGRSFKVYLISMAHQFVAFSATGIILAVWQ